MRECVCVNEQVILKTIKIFIKSKYIEIIEFITVENENLENYV